MFVDIDCMQFNWLIVICILVGEDGKLKGKLVFPYFLVSIVVLDKQKLKLDVGYFLVCFVGAVGGRPDLLSNSTPPPSEPLSVSIEK